MNKISALLGMLICGHQFIGIQAMEAPQKLLPSVYAKITFVNKTGHDITVKTLYEDPARNAVPNEITVPKVSLLGKPLSSSTLELQNLNEIKGYQIKYKWPGSVPRIGLISRAEKMLLIDAKILSQRLAQQNSDAVNIIINPYPKFGYATDFSTEEYNILPRRYAVKSEKLEESFIGLPSTSNEVQLLHLELGVSPQAKPYEILQISEPPLIKDPQELLSSAKAVTYRKLLEEKYAELINKLESGRFTRDKSMAKEGIHDATEKLLNIVRFAHDSILHTLKAK